MSAASGSASLSVRRRRVLTLFLWASAFTWGIGLGAKLFDLVVLASAWGASPPESLALMPYGRAYPFNPGDFFQPLSGLLVVAAAGSLAAGWSVSRGYRTWLLVPVSMLVLIWVLTPTVFWPLLGDLWSVAKGRATLGNTEVVALTHQWFVWDAVRTLLIAVGFVASLHAMSAGPRA